MCSLSVRIRRFRAAASLKRVFLRDPGCPDLPYPPLSGGGLIEADYWDACYFAQIAYPPLSGGGLIEASKNSLDKPVHNCIRRFRAAASLKPALVRRPSLPYRAYPPLSGGGLIEATARLSDLPALSPYPPLSGGGLIEAMQVYGRARYPAIVSAAFGRRPH